MFCQGNGTVWFVSFVFIFKGRGRVAPHALDWEVKSLCVNNTGLLSHDLTLQCFHRSHKNCSTDICIWFQLQQISEQSKSPNTPKTLSPFLFPHCWYLIRFWPWFLEKLSEQVQVWLRCCDEAEADTKMQMNNRWPEASVWRRKWSALHQNGVAASGLPIWIN